MLNGHRNTQIIYAFLLIRILLLYISTYVASNIMNQIYSERVLISGVEPQPLNYQLYLFIAIDVVLNLFLLGFIYGFTKLVSGNPKLIINSYIQQYCITSFIIVIVSFIISKVMYNKKYFLYKDDGLRAIRALQLMMFRCGIFITLLPFFIMCSKS